MQESFKKTFWIMLFGLLAGLSLFIFSQIDSLFKYAFSLLALYLGYLFFKKYEQLGLRITFIVVAIVFYLLSSISYAMLEFVKNNPEMFNTPV